DRTPWHDRVTALPAEVALDLVLAKELRAELTKVQPALDAARRLADLPEGRYPVAWKPDWISTLVHCQDARAIAALLRFCVTLQLHDRQTDEALNTAHALLNCARSIGDEPISISQLVRIAITAITINAVERILGQSEPSSAALEELERI